MKNNTDISLKKTNAGHVGSNRFQEGQKSLNIPSFVMEQWLDAALAED